MCRTVALFLFLFSFLCGEYPNLIDGLTLVSGEDPSNRVGPKKLVRAVADLVHG